MGVPKFFHYISERYPCLSELVKEYQIPGFDNLYLDMNGIIHTCSHPDDSDPTFRITEEKIFQDIFQYIEILFRMIKPQKLFFMAVDGVAPRAKMNQQRGRRFRSAKDVAKQETEAKKKNTAMPTSARFDSNCITPGTVFMTKLNEQLKYFVSNKITTDKLWQKCVVILSGHDTPGEGEHKIMDYIRYIRSQHGYDSNTRHCLYGLDADLVMLGLCSHEPHFSLLREEVKFGKKSLRKASPENTTFYMLHLSLMREYLQEEYKPVADKLPFEFNLESIIDDWVLMGFLVGNDFIPHLPNLHINNGALPLLYKTYMDVLPKLDGYINECGTINLKRFEKFMKALTEIDYKHFEDTYDDLQYFKSKTGHVPNSKERKVYKPQELEAWDADVADDGLLECLEPNGLVNKDLANLIKQTDDFSIDDPSEPSITELSKIFLTEEDSAEERDMQIEMEFQLHKKNYYESKMDFKSLTADTLLHLSYEYIRALQWILNYYYNGVCSWSWFYPYHYAPYISDIKGYVNMNLDFDLAKPFLPYEQLLAVLPPASRDSLPKPFHYLMTDPNSPIKDFYPDDFSTDLNGKRQEWEAVVLIPFIDEERLLTAMYLPLTELNAEERKRNCHGPMLVYKYSSEDLGSCYAPEYFPTIHVNHAKCTPLTREAIYIPTNKLVKGLCKDAAQGVFYPGFPTMRHLNYKSNLLKKKVKVFDQPSRDYNMILSIIPPTDIEEPEIMDITKEYLGKTIFVRWPHLTEAKVIAVSNAEYRYDITSDGKGYNVTENQGNFKSNFETEKSVIETHYMERRGIDVGPTNFLIHVRELVGRRYEFLNEGKIRANLAKEYAAVASSYPIQTVVKDIDTYDEHRSKYQELNELFHDGTVCFMLGQPHYGATGKVIHCQETFDKGRVKVQMQVADDPNFTDLYRLNDSKLREYYTQHSAATRLSLSYGTLARITGTVLVGRGAAKNQAFEEASKANVGLNLKHGRKNQGIPGYVKSIDSRWYYSDKCLQLIDSYRNEFFSLFQFLNTSNTNNLVFEIDIFPQDKGDGTTLKKIQEWLSKQAHTSIEMQNCDSKVLETEVVKEMENMITIYNEDVRHKQIKMTVRPHCIHIPGLISGNLSADNSATFELFDRVVNIRECYTVPVGFSGTVVAVHKVSNDIFAVSKKDNVLLDVLFDEPFAGGVSLNGSSPNRSYRMSPNDIINKSHGDRQLSLQLEKKTPNYQAYKPAAPQENAQSSAFVTWNNNIRSNQSNRHNTNYLPPQNRAPPIQPIAAHIPNIPSQIQRQQQQPMFVNTDDINAHVNHSDKPESVAFNSNNIPCHNIPPHAKNNHSQENNYNQSNNGQFFGSSNTPSMKADSPKKAFARNEPSLQSSSPSKSPMRPIQKKVNSPVKADKPQIEEVQKNIEKRPTANQPGTEMLRNLLQLNEKENQRLDQNVSKASGSNSVDNFFQMASFQAHASRFIDPKKKVASPQRNVSATSLSSPLPPPPQVKEFPSAQLLSFFVTHGMGCPMYSYSNSQGGFKAEVQIPTNQSSNMVVVSTLCDTQKAATEDVAAKTLHQLKTVDLSIFMPAVPPIPNPPQKWCTDNQLTSRQWYSSQVLGHPATDRTVQVDKSPRKSELSWRSENISFTTDHSGPSSRSVPFVPLQVTRKNYKKPINSDPIVRSTTNTISHKQKMGPEPQFQQVKISSGQQKPQAGRQMRIAANFSNKPI